MEIMTEKVRATHSFFCSVLGAGRASQSRYLARVMVLHLTVADTPSLTSGNTEPGEEV